MRNEPLELLPGTLDLLILKAVNRGPLHGYAIMQILKEQSDEVLQVGESSLYPALQRLLLQGWIEGEWSRTQDNRRARYYRVTRAGRKQLDAEIERYQRVAAAIGKILQPA